MVEGQEDYYGQFYNEASVRLKDLEEKQMVLKERLLLIGKNLIDTRENTMRKITDIKKDVETMKEDIEKIKNFIETISTEFAKFARKEDLEILSKQAKMFQPLELIKKNSEEKR